MTTPALKTQSSDTSSLSNEMLPVDPFRSLYVHFGMLLGVDDFQTLDAYHRGKMWYHNAWLHGSGVVWGLAVQLPNRSDSEDDDETTQFSGEIRVAKGLALDGMGRELLLDQAACLNLSAWYKVNKDKPEVLQAVEIDEETGDVLLTAHISLESRSCLNRQVPAMSEPCHGSATTTAYSRVVETVKVCMNPGQAEAQDKSIYPRLNLLFGLVLPRSDDDDVILDSDQQVLDAIAEIQAASQSDKGRLWRQWFKHFAVLDQFEIEPDSSAGLTNFATFPHSPPAPVLLANLTLRLHQHEDNWVLLDGQVDPFVRPYLLPTRTIQSLLHCDYALGQNTESSSPVQPSPGPEDAGGPRIDSDSVTMPDTENLEFAISGSVLMKASVDDRSIILSAFDTRDGWVPCVIKQIDYNASANKVHVELRDAPAGKLIRLMVKGTGETPMLGRNRIPLAGGLDSPAGSQFEGNDFVFMFRARSGS